MATESGLLKDRSGVRLAGELLSVPGDKGANAGGKVTALVAGMLAGADSIDSGVRGLNALLATVTTSRCAPVIIARRAA